MYRAKSLGKALALCIWEDECCTVMFGGTACEKWHTIVSTYPQQHSEGQVYPPCRQDWLLNSSCYIALTRLNTCDCHFHSVHVYTSDYIVRSVHMSEHDPSVCTGSVTEYRNIHSSTQARSTHSRHHMACRKHIAYVLQIGSYRNLRIIEDLLWLKSLSCDHRTRS